MPDQNCIELIGLAKVMMADQLFAKHPEMGMVTYAWYDQRFPDCHQFGFWPSEWLPLIEHPPFEPVVVVVVGETVVDECVVEE